MAFKLGLLGSEYDLPPISWETGSAPDLTEENDLNLTTEKMLDGSEQHDYAEETVRRWTIPWNKLTAAQKATLDAIKALKAELNFISEYHGITSAAVVVESFDPAMRIDTYARTPLWRGTMVLREVK
jgi:hypothetical protein